MQSKYLILGATGSIGYAFTRELLNRGIPVDILVRDETKARNLFQNNPLLHIRTGDARNPEQLREAASDKDFLFFGLNVPYPQWETKMIPATEQILEAATQNRSTILFPGNIYAYGNTKEPITEDTVPLLETKKGRVRMQMEEMLQQAAGEGRCRVINLRLPDFWGPNVTNGLIRPLFGNAARKKPMVWMIRSDVPHQFVYTPDAARMFHLLSREQDLPPYALFNFGGHVVPSVLDFAMRISSLAGSPPRLKLHSRGSLKLLGHLVPVIRELEENFPQFENPILLDDAKLRNRFPGELNTELDTAIRETLEWFRKQG
ncbi:MAG: NAD-dependent epimerase/dehydratase family protein [Bacteroidales bacterium]